MRHYAIGFVTFVTFMAIAILIPQVKSVLLAQRDDPAPTSVERLEAKVKGLEKRLERLEAMHHGHAK